MVVPFLPPVSHHVLVVWRGGVLLTQRPLQAGSAHCRQPDEQRAVIHLELLVDVEAHRGDDVRSPQQVVVPAVIPIPNLETDWTVEEIDILRYVIIKRACDRRTLIGLSS